MKRSGTMEVVMGTDPPFDDLKKCRTKKAFVIKASIIEVDR